MSKGQAELEDLITQLVESVHGAAGIRPIRTVLKGMKKSVKCEAALAPFLIRTPLTWEDTKDVIWPGDPIKQEQNRFHFLQGDIVDTSMVLRLGEAQSMENHRLWMILSPDCDAVRDRFVLVAKVVEIDDSGRDEETKIHREWYSYATKLQTPKAFPLGKIFFDEGNPNSFYAKFDEPYFIEDDSKGFATTVRSLKVQGWHLLNALIQEKFTRSQDIGEAMRIRNL